MTDLINPICKDCSKSLHQAVFVTLRSYNGFFDPVCRTPDTLVSMYISIDLCHIDLPICSIDLYANVEQLKPVYADRAILLMEERGLPE